MCLVINLYVTILTISDSACSAVGLYYFVSLDTKVVCTMS